MQVLSDAGVYQWFVSESEGGLGWSTKDLTEAYVRLSKSCLSASFILTQRIAALRRIAMSTTPTLRRNYLEPFLSGEATATVGISHLTTSRRHLAQPVLQFEPAQDGYTLSGFCPWVTGAQATDAVLVGAEVSSGQQILAVVPTNAEGVVVEPGFSLVALTETHTGPVALNDVFISHDNVVAGPSENVLATMGSHGTGSFQTTALALGLSSSAIEFLTRETSRRPDLQSSTDELSKQLDAQVNRLLLTADGDLDLSKDELRADANSLVLRATQAAMVAAKGAGFTSTHPVGRWCREALFFLVWSCPQAVRDSNLCELAGVEV